MLRFLGSNSERSTKWDAKETINANTIFWAVVRKGVELRKWEIKQMFSFFFKKNQDRKDVIWENCNLVIRSHFSKTIDNQEIWMDFVESMW